MKIVISLGGSLLTRELTPENFKKYADVLKRLKKEGHKLIPDYTFIKDLVAGRPVLTDPLNVGGFRLRFGRSRTSGYSS